MSDVITMMKAQNEVVDALSEATFADGGLVTEEVLSLVTETFRKTILRTICADALRMHVKSWGAKRAIETYMGGTDLDGMDDVMDDVACGMDEQPTDEDVGHLVEYVHEVLNDEYSLNDGDTDDE